jgi:PEP-CTERM motif
MTKFYFIVAVCLAALPASTFAVPMPAYTGLGATAGGATGNLNIGREFSVTGDGITISALGVFDFGSDGLVNSHVVTLFSIGSLGANPPATPITGGSVTIPAGTGATLDSGMRFENLAGSIYLPAGDYSVIAYGLNSAGGDPYGDNGGLPSGGNITHFGFDPYQFTANVSPAFPTGGDGNNHSSASFQFVNGPVVPEPATVTLSMLGLGGLLLRRRRSA